MLGGAAFFAIAVGYVWRRRVDALAVSLLVMLLAALEWSVAYALELSVGDPGARQLWGDLKYVGICLLTPAWLAFVFHYIGRPRWPTRLVGALLAIEPLAVLVVLANGATHLLVNLRVGPFGMVDLSPFAFTVTAAVLVFGVFRFGLLDQRPMARSQIFETIGDPVLVLDPYGRVIDANPAAGRLVGLSVAAIIGRSAVRLLPALGDRAVGQVTASEISLAGHTYDLDISPLPGRPGRRGGQLLVARDITEIRQAQQMLRAALDRERIATDQLGTALAQEQAATEHLRGLDDLKSAFMQAVSHDLRTPLASVLGIAVTLERSRWALPTDEADDLLSRLTSNARRLDRILSGLLDLDRLARGIVEPRRELTDLGELVATVVDRAGGAGRAARADLPALPSRLRRGGPRARVRRRPGVGRAVRRPARRPRLGGAAGRRRRLLPGAAARRPGPGPARRADEQRPPYLTARSRAQSAACSGSRPSTCSRRPAPTSVCWRPPACRPRCSPGCSCRARPPAPRPWWRRRGAGGRWRPACST